MTYEEAIQKLKELGWCYSDTYPYSGAFNQKIVGPRANTESYGPFPLGWVKQEFGRGETIAEALEEALRSLNVQSK